VAFQRKLFPPTYLNDPFKSKSITQTLAQHLGRNAPWVAVAFTF